MSVPYAVVVHIGAGVHAEYKNELYREIITQACMHAQSALISGKSCLDAVVAAISFLEDCPYTNAGKKA